VRSYIDRDRSPSRPQATQTSPPSSAHGLQQRDQFNALPPSRCEDMHGKRGGPRPGALSEDVILAEFLGPFDRALLSEIGCLDLHIQPLRRSARKPVKHRGHEALENPPGTFNCSDLTEDQDLQDVVVVGASPRVFRPRSRWRIWRQDGPWFPARPLCRQSQPSALPCRIGFDFLEQPRSLAALQGHKESTIACHSAGRRYRPPDPRPRCAFFMRRNRLDAVWL